MVLPVANHREEFLKLLKNNQVVVLTGSPGSGKTTQIPQYVLDQFKEIDPECKKLVACTQPGRLATVKVAEQVAEERNVKLGEEVGFRVRHDDKTSDTTRLVYITDDMLVNEMMYAKNLTEYKCVIIDEAHERSVNTDVILASLKNIIARRRRRDLKIVIMSATLNVGIFRQYFDNAPLMEVEGRMFPVTINHLEEVNSDYILSAMATVRHIHEKLSPGDILVFLPGEGEVQELYERLRRSAPETLCPLPFYATLSPDEQTAVFNPTATNARKCIIATDVPEKSITIDGIVYVIDSGLVKKGAWNPRLRLGMSQLSPISKASAAQRACRAGQTKESQSFRLYTEEAYNQMVQSNSPGIKTQDFTDTMLRLMASGRWESPRDWNLITLPDVDFLARASGDLMDLGYITKDAKVTASGTMASKVPLHPQWVYAIEAAKEFDAQLYLITLAAIASVDKSMLRESYDHRQVLQIVYRQWANPNSDHIAQLNAYFAYQTALHQRENMDIQIWCRHHMLNLRVLEEIDAVKKQLILKFAALHEDQPGWVNAPKFDHTTHLKIRKSLARGLFMNIAMRLQPSDDAYRTIHQNMEALIDPYSVTVEGNATWVVYSSVHGTEKPYMKPVTEIEPEWIADLPYFKADRMPKNNNGAFRQAAIHEALERVRNVA